MQQRSVSNGKTKQNITEAEKVCEYKTVLSKTSWINTRPPPPAHTAHTTNTPVYIWYADITDRHTHTQTHTHAHTITYLCEYIHNVKVVKTTVYFIVSSRDRETTKNSTMIQLWFNAFWHQRYAPNQYRRRDANPQHSAIKCDKVPPFQSNLANRRA
jgi:hypothetical protein